LLLLTCSANDACIKTLFKTPIKNELPANDCIFHQRCGCHILNLIVPNGVCGSGTCMSVVTFSILLLAVALLACLFVGLLACLFVALLACCLTGLLPCSSSSVVVAWSLCTLWLLGSQAVIFNDARD
jgi:hypothetical protein